MKIRPVGAVLFYAGRRTDGSTDMTKLIVVFHNFANGPKNQRRRIFTLDCSQKTSFFAEQITVLRGTSD